MTAAVRERPRIDEDTIASHRAAPARKTSARSTKSRSSRPKLKVLNQQAIRQRARRRNALLTLFILVLLGFFAVAFIQAQLVADQQDLDVLRARIAKAEIDNARMARDVEIASSPEIIVGRATGDLGMVRAYQPLYLEAVAPVRDIPSAPIFDPETPQGFQLAAPQAASADGITAGISSGAAVAASEPVVAADTLPPQTPEQSAVDTEVADQAPVAVSAEQDQSRVEVTTTTPSLTTSALGGVSVASDGGAADQTIAAQTVTPEATAAVPAETAQGVGSIAGSRAVTGGSGNG